MPHFNISVCRTAIFLFLLLFITNLPQAKSTQQADYKTLISQAKQNHLIASDILPKAFLLTIETQQASEAAIECANLAIELHLPQVAGKIIEQCLTKKNSNKLKLPNLYLLWGNALLMQNKAAEASTKFESALSLIKPQKDTLLAGQITLGLGRVNYFQRQYVNAIERFDEAHDLAVKCLNEELRLNALHYKGLVFAHLANYPKAIEMQLLVNEIATKLNFQSLMANSMMNVGLIYLNVGQFTKAHEAFDEATELFVNSNDSLSITRCLVFKGETFLNQGNTAKALNCFHQSTLLSQQMGDTLSMVNVQINMGQVEFRNGNHQQAIKHYLQAVNLSKHLNDKSLNANINYHFGQAFLAMGNLTSAENYLNQAAETAGNLGELFVLSQCYNALSLTFEQQGDFSRALKMKNQCVQLKDSILNEQTIEYIARMDAIYRSLQKENIIKTLKAENASVQKSLEKQKYMRIIFIAASAFLALISIILLLAFRYKQKSTKKLAQMNQELAHLNATKDKFFSIISHDLKSPINSTLGFSEMIVLHAEAGNTKKLLEFGQMVHNSTKKLYTLVDNLLLWSRTQLGSTPYQPQNIDIGIQCNNIISLLKLNAEEKDILIISKIEKNLMAFADINLFNTVVRNLISNAIKFSQVGASVTVSAKQQDNNILVSVADTGVGIPLESLEKLFRIDSTVSTLGTFNEKGSGLGLILCKEFVEINKGKIGAESEPGKGSVFYFTVPLAHQM